MLCFGVDIGNSGIRVAELHVVRREIGKMLRVNWCSKDNNAVRRCSDASHRYLPSDPAWLTEIESFMADQAYAAGEPGGCPALWLISSVRRDASAVLQGYLDRRSDQRQEVVTYASIPLNLNVDFPERVGVDRLLAALAATELLNAVTNSTIALAQPPARLGIVVQAGSAVTVDLISTPHVGSTFGLPTETQPTVIHTEVSPPNQPLGTFEGGAIVPGVPMMLRLLGQAADLLPEIDADDLLDLPKLPGKSTEDAMVCGTASALVGGVGHLVKRYREQAGQALPVILSGGDGMRLSPYLDPPVQIKSHLVHHGLLKMAELKLVK